MKALLAVAVSLMLTRFPDVPDHIGIYADAGGSSCLLAPGFTTTVTVIHKYTDGATGSRFKIQPPAGSTMFAFNSPFLGIPADPTGDIALGYGQCLTGNIVLGTVIATWAPGWAYIVSPEALPSIMVTDCGFEDHMASGGIALVGGDEDPCVNATESSTWGRVKSLYR